LENSEFKITLSKSNLQEYLELSISKITKAGEET
jgi:hypothetical protein